MPSAIFHSVPQGVDRPGGFSTGLLKGPLLYLFSVLNTCPAISCSDPYRLLHRMRGPEELDAPFCSLFDLIGKGPVPELHIKLDDLRKLIHP